MSKFYTINGETLTGIADAIRSKTGGTDPITAADMDVEINGIHEEDTVTVTVTNGVDFVVHAISDLEYKELTTKGESTTLLATRGSNLVIVIPGRNNLSFGPCSNLTEVVGIVEQNSFVYVGAVGTENPDETTANITIQDISFG